MADTVSGFLIKRLMQWGIRSIYGYPGDGINGILGALNQIEDAPKFVQVRHEESASFMACAHAKFTGEVGVCLATSGPGAIHLLNGLYDARMDHQPVVAIVGQQPLTALGSSFIQEVDLHSLFKDVARDYVQTLSTPEQARHVIDRALRIAIAERTVTCIIVPADVQEESAVEEPPRAHGMNFSGIGYSAPRVIPKESDLRRAADVLNEGKKVAILIGAGALHATDEVIEIADVLGAGIAKALLGKAAVPDDIPFVTGTIGLLGTQPSWDMMSNCDTLLMIGTSFPYTEFLPKAGQARGVQIDLEGRQLSLRYPMEVNLAGDSAETLRGLLPYLQRKSDRSWQEQIMQNVTEWWSTLEARSMNEANPLNPQRVFWELSPRLPENCIICGDSGSSTYWFALDLKMRRGMMASVSGKLASMGSGVTYAIAAKFAYPQRMVVAIIGDGAMQMNGNNELITIAKYWKQWINPQLIILVVNNRDLNLVTWEQRILAGDPKFEASQDIPDFSYAQYAESLGLKGIVIDSPEKVTSGWEEAFAADRPVLVEAITDPTVPPLPPHITFEQAKNFTTAILKGDPQALDVIRNSVQSMIEGVLPGSGGEQQD